MNIVEIRKELEKYGSLREKVLRLNEIGKFKSIYYGSEYISYYDMNDDRHCIIDGWGGCRFCHVRERNYIDYIVQLKIKNRNGVNYYACYECTDKKLCAYCLREKENCSLLTKNKITFMLCTKNIFPKDIRRLITNLFYKN